MVTIALTRRSGEILKFQGTEGFSLMEAIREAGVDELEATCGGCCSCATCHVFVGNIPAQVSSIMSEDEDDLLSGATHRQGTSRLSCQVILSEDMEGMQVSIAPED